jgi:hypothetical protein
MSDDPSRTPASIAMDEAIEFNIEHGGWLFPDGSLFVDAGEPGLGRAIAEAVDEGRAVVLCYDDGTRRVIEARPSVKAS